MSYSKVQIVDENDVVIGAERLFDAIETGAIRRASRVFVFNSDGLLLVQKRSKNVRKPLLFDQSVGGHVDEDETYHEAAVREMKEEIGIEGFVLKEVVTSYRDTEFFNAIYTTTIQSETEINFDKEEVDSIHWMSVSEVDILTTNSPEKCTSAFVEIWQKFKNKLIE